MPLPPRTHCKLEGCNEPAYTWPNGSKSTYCRAHLKLRNTKKRDGLEPMSGQMKRILQYLRDAKERGEPFVALSYPLAQRKTLHTLMERDWVFRSTGLDGSLTYKITSRGEKALDVYEPIRNRKDGICPHCNERPRPVWPSGKLGNYCAECESEIGKHKRTRPRKAPPQKPCPRCKKRERRIYPNGRYSAYCKRCETVNRRKNARKQRRRELKLVQAGGPAPLCAKCKQQPVCIHPNSLSKYCLTCKRTVEESAKYTRILKAHGIRPGQLRVSA